MPRRPQNDPRKSVSSGAPRGTREVEVIGSDDMKRDTARILVASDVHGRIPELLRVTADFAQTCGTAVDAVLVSGDLGVWPHDEHLDTSTSKRAHLPRGARLSSVVTARRRAVQHAIRPRGVSPTSERDAGVGA